MEYKFIMDTEVPEEVITVLQGERNAYIIKKGMHYKVFIEDTKKTSFWKSLLRRWM